jgi:lysozyme
VTHLEEQLIRHEGIRLKPYRCTAGYLTIGVGHNLDAHGITRAVALMMLQEDLRAANSDVEMIMDAYKIRPWTLGPARIDALINLDINMGARSLMGFGRMWAALRAEDWETAAVELLDSKWRREDVSTDR